MVANMAIITELTFLAATVEAWQDEPAIRGRLGEEGEMGALLQRVPHSGTNIMLRAYTNNGEIMVVDFKQKQGELPKLYRIEITQPTPDDRKYLEALEFYDIRPVDVEGKAFHG